MEKILFSIVVPVYKVPVNLLHRCINSIIEQTYKNLDIILVDDGSTDKTAIIVKDFIKNDSRFKLILKSNSYPKNLDNIYAKFDEKNKSQFMTVLAENQLFDSSILNFYISTQNDDGISYYSEKIDGLVDIVEGFYIPSSIDEIFKEIQKVNTIYSKQYKTYIKH